MLANILETVRQLTQLQIKNCNAFVHLTAKICKGKI